MDEYKPGKGKWEDDDTPQPDWEPAGLNDQSIIQFGKHRGKMLSQVPADYLLWLYDQPRLDPMLKAYIEENFDSPQFQAKQLSLF